MKILIIKLGALGDVIRTSYFLPELNRLFPGAEIYWLTNSNAVDLLRFNPYISHILCTDIGDSWKSKEPINFDIIYSFDDEIDSLEVLKNLKFKRIVGAFLDGEQITYTEDSNPWFNMGLISKLGKTQADILKRENTLTHTEIFNSILHTNTTSPSFFNDKKIELRVTDKYLPQYYHLGLNLWAGQRWPSKSLRLREAELLIKKLVGIVFPKPLKINVLGKELQDGERLLKEKFGHDKRVIFQEPVSLPEFAAIIKNLDLLITSDSMALHMAIAQGIYSISFYAPTSATEIDTFGKGKKITSMTEDYCSYRGDADNSTLTADRIINEVKKHLRTYKSKVKSLDLSK